jgi:hypothetical protein
MSKANKSKKVLDKSILKVEQIPIDRLRAD